MINSIASTTCSSPTNDSVEKIIKNDTIRYKRKGYGLFMAILGALTFFFAAPRFLNFIYPSLISGKDERWFAFLTATGVHTSVNLVCYIASYFIYNAKSPFLERYKVSDAPWPWESNPKEWKILLKKSIALFFVNNFVIAPLLAAVDIFTNGVLVRTATDTLPTSKDIILQLSFCMIIEDFFFYWGHRLLHHPKLYPYIHKVHHQYTETVSIANEYAHPLEFFLSNLIPSAIGPKLLGKQMHIITFWMWIVLRVGESVDGHCGYDFSWSPFRLLPLSGSSTYHNFHHSANVGNYCSLFTFWDTVFNTNRDYWKWLSRRQKQIKSQEIVAAYNELKSKLQKDPDYRISQLDGRKPETNPTGTTDIASGHEKTE